MTLPHSRVAFVIALIVALLITIAGSSHAQRPRGDEGTGGAAGHSPSTDMPNAMPPPPAESRSLAVPAQGAPEEIKLGGRRIVGGEKTVIKEHPWQVALNIKTPEGTFLCGGSIIAQRWVLTAAHCIEPGTKSRDVKAKAGATNYVTSGAWTPIERVVVHENYNPNTHENDLALLKLASPPSGKVIPFADGGMTVPVGQPLEVTGWGATSEGGDAARNLLKGTVPYVDSAVCNEPASFNGQIRAGMMCAGHRDGGKGLQA